MKILDIILKDFDKRIEDKKIELKVTKELKKYIVEYKAYQPEFKPYFKSSFSPGTTKWGMSTNVIGTSIGNGAMMRISPIGYLFDTKREVITNAKLATIPSIIVKNL